jgi:hypothetical protein
MHPKSRRSKPSQLVFTCALISLKALGFTAIQSLNTDGGNMLDNTILLKLSRMSELASL